MDTPPRSEQDAHGVTKTCPIRTCKERIGATSIKNRTTHENLSPWLQRHKPGPLQYCAVLNVCEMHSCQARELQWRLVRAATHTFHSIHVHAYLDLPLTKLLLTTLLSCLIPPACILLHLTVTHSISSNGHHISPHLT